MNALYQIVERRLAGKNVCVVLPSGQRLGSPDAAVTMQLRGLEPLHHLVNGQVGKLAADYVEGRIDLLGTPRAIVQLAGSLVGNLVEPASWLDRLKRYVATRVRHTLQSDAKQIQFHYDVNDDFYALWLDSRRVYSCAYWRNQHWDASKLEQAQLAKLDHICRKLKLSQGDNLLDVGCGWGGLLLHAVQHYGVNGTGITLSKNQYSHVKILAEENHCSGRLRVKLLDYRELTNAMRQRHSYDKIASVGMLEHVGRANLGAYFSTLSELAFPGALVLNHGITSATPRNLQLGGGVGNFIQDYIFPGGELHHISHLVETMAVAGHEVLDVENLRPHYAKTLWAWSEALEAKQEQAAKLVGEKVVRAYRLYLAGSALNFERGWLSLHQVLSTARFETPPTDFYPFNREYMYKERDE